MKKAVVKKGWHDAGRVYQVLGEPVFCGQRWTPVLAENEEDPEFFKTEGLEELPDRKPEPTKSCDTCGASHTHCKTISGEHYCADWQKKEPEKNCGNCRNYESTDSAGKALCDLCIASGKDFMGWQPKAAEPQGWEQRACSNCNYKSACAADKIHNTCTTIDAIRAEIERVRKEEREKGRREFAPLISAIEMAFKEADFLPDHRLTRKAQAVFAPIRQALAEQNGHREGVE